MKKYIANFITLIRVILAPFLMFFSEITVGFLVLFSICGLSDIIDGPIARATKTTSQIGSVLDTIGDFLLYLSVFKVIFFNGSLPLIQLIVFAAAMALHLVAAVYAKFKFKKFFFIHNILSKVLGVLIFIVPFVLFFTKTLVTHMTTVIIVAVAAGVESILIVALSIDPDPNIKNLKQALRGRNAQKAPEQEETAE